MATTATYSADVLVSSGGVNGSQTQWEYSVPVRQDVRTHCPVPATSLSSLQAYPNDRQSFSRRSKSRTSHDSHRKSRDRTSKESRSSSMSRQPYMSESNYRNTSRGRRDHSRGRGSEAGSSRGVYNIESGSRSAGNIRESTNGAVRGNSDEEAKWIHRDKLAKIESEELHQAALLFHRRTGIETKSIRGRSQAGTRQRGISESSETTPPTEHTEPWPNMSEEQHYHDTAPFEDNNTATADNDERKNWDLRRPEEIAADEAVDDGASSMYRNPGLRKSSSRIPIPRTTTAPNLPTESRSRAQTLGDDDATSSTSKPRRASEPLAVDCDAAPTPNGSRPNSRGAQATMQSAGGRRPTAKSAQGSTNRKTSAPATSRKTTTTKSRTTSGANGTQRPTTRGDSRPITAVNRPEGDPPWLATMYKPDPRLPPDQQIIPTHARQMMQQQWEKEGKTPTTYDREFAPLAIADDAPPSNNNNTNDNNEKAEEPSKEEQQQQQQPQEKPETKGNNTWPLSSKDLEPTQPSTGPGYSPMPRVQEPPPAGLTPKWSPPVVTAQEPPPPKEKKGGCGCCIVM